jgi:hypothetical protein
MPLPSAPIDQFDEATTVQPEDWAVIFQVASGKTLKTRSSNFGIDSPSSNYNWSSTFDYPVDDIVEYQGKLYKSLQTPNLAQVPTASGSLYWELVVKATSSSLAVWAPGTYIEEKVFVMYDTNQDDAAPAWGLYALKNPPTRPFISVDFPAELAAGNWSPASSSNFASLSGDPYDNVALSNQLRKTRTVTGADTAVQGDDNSVIIFNSATPFNFTLPALTATATAKTKISFVNKGAGAVTLINGGGVALDGNPVISGRVGNIITTAFVTYETSTTPLVVGGAGSVAVSHYGPSTTGTTAYVTTLTPALAALSSGVEIAVKFSDASTGAATLNPNGLGAKKMFKDPTTQIGAADITDEQTYEFYYDASLDSAAGGWMRIGGGSGASFTVASSAEINTGTDNAKGITPLGLEGSKYEAQNGLKTFINGTSGTNTYTGNLSPAITAYGSGGLKISVKFTNANSGASTLAINGLSALPLVRPDGSALVSGDIPAGSTKMLIYDGTSLIMLNPTVESPEALNAVALVSTTLTLDWGSAPRKNFDLTTTLANGTTPAITIVISGSSMRSGKLFVRATGVIAISMPITCVMDVYEQSVGRWVVTTGPTTKTLTIQGVTASPFYFTFEKDSSGNIWVHVTNYGL